MKVTVYIATSTNGFISNTRNVPDWLSAEYGRGLVQIAQKTKAMIMGKKTYDILAPDYLPLKGEGRTIVLTSGTADAPANPTVEFTSNSPKEIVAKLEKEGFSDAVIIGGAAAVSAFVNAGLVTDVVQVVEPVLFKDGLPLLKNVNRDYKLQLTDVAKLNAHTVQLHYQVVKD